MILACGPLVPLRHVICPEISKTARTQWAWTDDRGRPFSLLQMGCTCLPIIRFQAHTPLEVAVGKAGKRQQQEEGEACRSEDGHLPLAQECQRVGGPRHQTDLAENFLVKQVSQE